MKKPLAEMEILNQIKSHILSSYKKKEINAIVLHGSRARGDSQKDSDYDVNVYLQNNKAEKSLNMPEKDIYIDCVNADQFAELKKKAHPFLYCCFRDGISLYQKNLWFNKTKEKILKLNPKKEIIYHYLLSSFALLKRINKRKEIYLDYEDGKIAANQLGFALLMNNRIYPKTPHSLKKEIIRLNKKYKKIAEAISYVQNKYYYNKKSKIKEYKTKIKILYSFTKNYIKRSFPEKLKDISEIKKPVAI